MHLNTYRRYNTYPLIIGIFRFQLSELPLDVDEPFVNCWLLIIFVTRIGQIAMAYINTIGAGST